MKFLLDFLPVLIFFVLFKWAGNHTLETIQFLQEHFSWLIHGTLNAEVAPTLLATIGVIGASALQIVVMKAMRKKIPTALWIGVIIITVMGGITLWFSDPLFVKLKPSILYGLFALIIALGQFRGNNIIQMMLGKQLPLPPHIWSKAAWQWCFLFIALTGLNTAIALYLPTETWVNFKVWGLTILLMIFSIGQVIWFSKYLPKDAQTDQLTTNDSVEINKK
jgi:intracellular septation protein